MKNKLNFLFYLKILNKMKCKQCKKKMVLSFDCKCTQSFCINCLPSFMHGCKFDYKEEKKKILTDNNVKIEKEKVIII